jgi:hypothetical protein
LAVTTAGVVPAAGPPVEDDIRIVTESTVIEVGANDLPDGDLLSSSGGCKHQNVTRKIQQKVDGEWITRVLVWSDTFFCYDGSLLTTPGPTWDAGDSVVSSAGWEQVSWHAPEDGSAGDDEHWDVVDASYRQCIGFCTNHTDIYIRKHQHGNGSTELHTN